MAKRELSNTLMNLKFMHRATQGKKKTNEEDEAKLHGHLFSSGIVKKCVVIMEGDPHPGAIAGRMSFQSFNPSLDKLKEEESSPHQLPEPSNPCHMNYSYENSHICSREDGSSNGGDEDAEIGEAEERGSGEHKRKQMEPLVLKKNQKKPQKTVKCGNYSSPNGSRRNGGYSGQQWWEKPRWNVLQPRNRSQGQNMVG